MEKEEIFDRPPGPLGGLWSVYYIDAWKFLIRQFQGFRHVRKEAFKNTLKLGTPMPPVKLRATDGTEFNLSDFHGKKNIVIEFGSITCPPYRRRVAGVENLREKYKDKDVEFFVVYSKEPHAGERRYFKKYRQHSSYEHKKRYAGELVQDSG